MMSKEWGVVKLVGLVILFASFTIGQTNKNYDVSLKIIHKPKANYPSQEKGTICVQGTVTLRVQFLETGEIGTIKAVNELPYGLTESAIEATKKIKFKPARKNGKPVTVFKQVQYNFTLY